MKKFISFLFMMIMVCTLTACSDFDGVHNNEAVAETESADLSNIQLDRFTFSKDGVDELWEVLEERYATGEFGDEKDLDWVHEQLHKITSNTIKEQMGVELFDMNRTVFMVDEDEVKVIGYNMINAVPWDYDGDGNLDLLIASEFGSGIRQVALTVYDTQKGETINIYNEHAWDEWYYNLAVYATSSDNGKDARFEVYKVKYNYEEAEKDTNHVYEVDMTANELLGYVYVENGEPVYKECK